MAVQRRYLLNREVQSSDAATRIVQLPRSGILSALDLRAEMTNGATSGVNRIRDDIDKVEVIANGSEVLFSLEGMELERWQYVFTRRAARQVLTAIAGAVQELFLLIPFGRYIGDPDYAIDLSRYQTVELRITYSTTISATTFVTGTTTFSVIMYLWPEGSAAVAPRNYFRLTQFRALTTAASGEDVTELPRRFPILDVMVYDREAGIADGVNITQAEIRENDGLSIPYTGRWLDIQAENHHMLDIEAVEEGIHRRTDADTIDTLVSRIKDVQLTLLEAAGAADSVTPQLTIRSLTADRVTLSILETDEDGTTSASALATALYTIHWSAKGIGIGNAILLPLWDLKDPQTAYPAPSKDKVTLALTQADAGGTCRASVRELAA